MNLPDRTVPAPDVVCPECWAVHHVRGAVHAIVAADGAEIYLRCSCGAIAERGLGEQLDLFGRTAA